MSVKVLYFAGLREALGCAGESVELDGAANVGALRERLAARGEAWAALANMRNLRQAVNQDLVAADAAIRDGDEIAFFPPVTGG